jgi:uncharacterized protein YdhG (YjbR/CyaY superfamily)
MYAIAYNRRCPVVFPRATTSLRGSPAAIDAVRSRLDGFAASKGLIRFTSEHPVPDDVVLELVRLRLAEIRA